MTAFPHLLGPYVLLRPISPPDDPRPVFLVGVAGSDKPWALKRLGSGSDEPPFDIAKAEGKALARLNDPRLVNVLDVAMVEGAPVLVMGFVAGRSLADLRVRVSPSAEVATLIAHDVVGALLSLDAFERSAIGHGNVSSRTIMLSATGEVRLVGFRPGHTGRRPSGHPLADDLRAVAQILSELLGPATGYESPSVAAARTLTATLQASPPNPVGLAEAAETFSKFPAPPVRAQLAQLVSDHFGAELERDAAEQAPLLLTAGRMLAGATGHRSSDEYPIAGTKIGPYLVVRTIGEGGMGRVLEARDQRTGKRAAIKILHPARRTPSMEERFRREAAATTRISSPHVVQIETFGETDNGKLLYMAMEFLDGPTLGHVIQTQGPLEQDRALHIGLQLAQAVAAAHAVGVIHRDLKPGNVVLLRQGSSEQVKIVDFGLARMETPQDLALTQAGDLVGTFVYAAPEQVQARKAAPSFDIYALGELLYEMLSQTLPHVGQDNHELLKRKITADPTLLSLHRRDIDPSIEAVVMRALARLPEDRQSSATELADDLAGLIKKRKTQSADSKRVRRIAIGLALGAVVATALLLRGARTSSSPTKVTLDPPPVQPINSVARPFPIESAVSAPVPKRQEPLPPPKLAHPVSTANRASPSPQPKAGSPLRQAERAFEAGHTIEAIQLATEALDTGAPTAAHLALGKYYTKLRLPREALRHYKSVLIAEPSNEIATAAVTALQAAGHR